MHPPSIGRYRIIGTLGEGGMGTVYEAVQDHPQRTVALKVIRPDFMSPELLRRFTLESDILGRLQHPGIAQIYEAGTAEGPYESQSYFAMEVVRGHTLTQYAERQGLDLDRRLELFAKICDAVHYAHQQGVIHRDLKPANILVDTYGQPKILDFGVARLTNADVLATQQTTIGKVVGTLQYMSPEQITADPNEADARSDVYSLGVILYELLAGRLPYDLARKVIHEAAKVISLDEPTPLSAVNRRLAGDVEIIVAKALEKERDRRYASADEFASDIRRYLRDEPIVARRASAIYQLRKFARRNRGLVGGMTVAAAVLVIGTVVSVALAIRATAAERLADTRRNEAVAAGALAERRRTLADSASRLADSARADAQREQGAAIASARRATGEAAKAFAINAFLQNMLASSDPTNARGKELSVRELLDQAGASTNAKTLSGQPEVRAAIETTIGRTYFALGLFGQASPHLDSAYAIRRRALAASDLSIAESADHLGTLAHATGDYPKAEARLNEALVMMRASLEPDDDRITSAIEMLANVRYQRGKFAEAESLYRNALRLTRSRHGSDGIEVAGRLKALGVFLSYTGRATAALPFLENALAIQRQTYGTNHPVVVDGLLSLSDAHLYSPNYAAAEKTLREALPIAHTVFGAEHPSIANISSRLGSALTNQRRFEEAEPPTRDALAMRIKLLGEQHPDVQLSRVELARLLQFQGARLAEAETLLTKALAGRRAVLGDSSPAIASTLIDMALVARAREDWPGAESRLRQAIPIWRASKIEDQELYTLGELGFSLQQQGKVDEADTVLAGVLVRRRALFGAADWSVGDAYDKMAAAAARGGRPAQAESLATLGLAIAQKVYGPRSAQASAKTGALASYVEAQGDTSRAIPLVRESLSMLATRPATDLNVIAAQRALAIGLCATGAAMQGDSVIRLAISHLPPNTAPSIPHRVRGVLGFCLTRTQRFAEAEPILLEAESGLRGPPALAVLHRATVRWLVSLYEQWGKPEQATVWKQRLAAR